MERFKGHRYLCRRGEQFVFRRSVPERARAAFGRSEMHVSLGISNVAEARHILPRELAKFEKTLAEATGARSSTEVPELPRRALSAQEIEEGVRTWFAERAGRIEQEVDAIVNEGQAARLTADYDALSQGAVAGVRVGGETALMTQWVVETLTERFGWQIAAGNPLHRRLIKFTARGEV